MQNADARRGLVLVVLALTAVTLHVTLGRSDPLVYHVTWSDAENLKTGDSVYLKGVEIGQIEDVDLREDLTVRVRLRIRDRYRSRVTRDLRHMIVNDKFLFGKKAVQLVPVGERERPVTAGDELAGTGSYPGLLLDKGTDTVESAWNGLRRWTRERWPWSGTGALGSPSPDLPEADGGAPGREPAVDRTGGGSAPPVTSRRE